MSTSGPLAAVTGYIGAFNDGDSAAMAALFDTDGVILDGMAPHVWLGPSAARKWYDDVLIEASHHGASGYTVALGDPLHETVTSDRAYLALPASMSFLLQDRKVTQTGALFTVALRQHPEGWRITAWAWTKGRQL